MSYLNPILVSLLGNFYFKKPKGHKKLCKHFREGYKRLCKHLREGQKKLCQQLRDVTIFVCKIL